MLPTDRPSIVVLLLAYRRTSYFDAALRSVVAAVPTGTDVSVAVLSRARDRDWEEALGRVGVRLFAGSGHRLGPALTDAVDAMPGTMIALLDQDDLFHRTHLSRALVQFQEHPGLRFYRSALQRFRGESPPPDAAPSSSVRRAEAATMVVRSGALRPSTVAHWFWGNLAFCSSTVVVARDLLVRHRETIRRIYNGFSMALFWAAVAESGSMAFDPTPSIFYREHATNVSGQGSGRRTKWQRQVALAPTLVEQASVSIAEFDPRNAHVWARPLQAGRARNRLVLAVASPASARRDVLTALSDYVANATPGVLSKQWRYVILGAGRIASFRGSRALLSAWAGTPDGTWVTGSASTSFEGAGDPADP